jgi:hypothetical protein
LTVKNEIIDQQLVLKEPTSQANKIHQGLINSLNLMNSGFFTAICQNSYMIRQLFDEATNKEVKKRDKRKM